MTLDEAIAAVKRYAKEAGPLEAREFLNLTDPGDLALAQDAGPTEIALATVLNSVASGELIPRTGPTPPHGWNVMQVGQIGWHVVQAADGWKVSRLFGPEILPQDGNGDAIAPEPVANRDGGHGAADAPTLIPKADAEMAVALAYQRAAGQVREASERCEEQARGFGGMDGRARQFWEWTARSLALSQEATAILALAPADALAEVERMKAEIAELKTYRDYGPRMDEKRQAAIMELALGADRIDRMEAKQAAEAEVARLKEALNEAREAAHGLAHNEYDGVWNEQDFADLTPLADAALKGDTP